jgi:uncharacterized protein (TIGR03084 family)
MTDVAAIAADLTAEQDALDEVVAGLAAESWATPTPSPGWTVADQIGHLTYFDGAAVTAITDPGAFKASIAGLLADPDGTTLHRHLGPEDLLGAWRENRRRLGEVARGLEPGQRVPWYGPSMSARSFLTARLMETWAHGQDVADAIGVERTPTDRLRHVAFLGVRALPNSYRVRDLPVPDAPVRVELEAPSGEVWTWGAEGADDVVRGPALDFCLVVTQRRHVDDTGLATSGPVAGEWLRLAQAFAGPAGPGRPPKR